MCLKQVTQVEETTKKLVSVAVTSVITSIRCPGLLNGRGSKGSSGIFISSSPVNHRPAYTQSKKKITHVLC